LCKDLEKAEFVGFSQIFSRNQEVIKGDWSRKTFFFFSVLKVLKLTPPLSRHLMKFPPTFRSATTPLSIVSEKICLHNMNQKLWYPRFVRCVVGWICIWLESICSNGQL
jgi:hypothetical protein